MTKRRCSRVVGIRGQLEGGLRKQRLTHRLLLLLFQLRVGNVALVLDCQFLRELAPSVLRPPPPLRVVPLCRRQLRITPQLEPILEHLVWLVSVVVGGMVSVVVVGVISVVVIIRLIVTP